MPITVPEGLPCPQDMMTSPVETRLQDAEGKGPTNYRSIELDERQVQQLAWTLTDEQAAIFRQWWEETLIFGGAWFSAPDTWPALDGRVVKVRRFTTGPQWQPLGAGLQRLTIGAELRGETLLPNEPAPDPGGTEPWLYYPTEDWPGEFEDSLAPIHKRTSSYAPITGAPEPFSYGVGVTDNVGLGDNEYSVVDVVIPLYGDSGVPTEGQYTWAPADPESGIVPVFSTTNPSGGMWAGSPAPNLFVSLSGAMSEWQGGVLTLYAGNDPGSSQHTIITFLPSSFIYPPVSVYYGPLA